jgi:hypothetical protein
MRNSNVAVQREVRAVFDRFIAAQNVHDMNAIGEVIARSPDFLWITTTKPLWGYEAALAHFAEVYKRTYNLAPKLEELKLTVVTDDAAQLYVPVDLTIGAAGKEAQRLRFMLHQIYAATPSGWKLISILPVRACRLPGLRQTGGSRGPAFARFGLNAPLAEDCCLWVILAHFMRLHLDLRPSPIGNRRRTVHLSVVTLGATWVTEALP